jgi:hypothetical protein
VGQIITFTNTFGIDLSLYEPQPARAVIPEWYKKTDSYISGDKKPTGEGNTSATIKRCMPVFDAMTAGYILTTYVDVYVSQKEVSYADQTHYEKTGETKLLTPAQIKKRKLVPTRPWYEWPSANPIQFHPIEQAPLHPAVNGAPFPKWINPWSIRTPKNWSVLFIAPMHHDSVFTIMPGIVDTDEYFAPTNFPFTLNDPAFEGLIPAGTPMVQAIPINRESWKVKVGEKEELEKQVAVTQKLRSTFFDSYKRKFRQDKNYS